MSHTHSSGDDMPPAHSSDDDMPPAHSSGDHMQPAHSSDDHMPLAHSSDDLMAPAHSSDDLMPPAHSSEISNTVQNHIWWLHLKYAQHAIIMANSSDNTVNFYGVVFTYVPVLVCAMLFLYSTFNAPFHCDMR